MRDVSLVLLLLAQLAGCSAYRVTVSSDYDAKEPEIREKLAAEPGEAIALVKLNPLPEGAHCFEALLFVLSVGIIPTHCVDRYHVSAPPTTESAAGALTTDVQVTSMQGWVALLLPLVPGWKFGYGHNVSDDIQCNVSGDC